MNKDYTVTGLFPIPLYRTNLGHIPKDIYDFIINLDFERTPADNNFYSVDKYVLNLPELKILRNKIEKHIDNFIYGFLDVKRNMDFRIENSWVNKHNKGDWTPEHSHGSSLISGCFYLDTNEDTGSITFFKDKTYYNLWTNTIRVDFNYQDDPKMISNNLYNNQSVTYCPIKNDLLLFPSLLNHEVEYNTSNTKRYSLAFNVFPRGTSGGPINTLTV